MGGAKNREKPVGLDIYNQIVAGRRQNEHSFSNKTLHLKWTDGAAETDT